MIDPEKGRHTRPRLTLKRLRWKRICCFVNHKEHHPLELACLMKAEGETELNHSIWRNTRTFSEPIHITDEEELKTMEKDKNKTILKKSQIDQFAERKTTTTIFFAVKMAIDTFVEKLGFLNLVSIKPLRPGNSHFMLIFFMISCMCSASNCGKCIFHANSMYAGKCYMYTYTSYASM